MTTPPRFRPVVLFLTGLAALVMIVAPVLGADSSAKPDKADKGEVIAKTLTGTVVSSPDAKGRLAFSMMVDGVTWELSAGPKWFWRATNPLVAFVGKSVVVTGTYRAGDSELDVVTIDGTAIRSPGKPPWAGGPKAVGEIHPGWKDGKPGDGHGRARAPGQLKDKSAGAADD